MLKLIRPLDTSGTQRAMLGPINVLNDVVVKGSCCLFVDGGDHETRGAVLVNVGLEIPVLQSFKQKMSR